MRITSTLAVSAVALSLVGGLAGCSSSPSGSGGDAESSSSAPSTPSTAATTTATPAAGETIAGDGYSYAVPAGWGKHDSAAAAGTDTIGIDLAPTGDFASNVNVVLSPAGAVTADQVESVVGKELESSGAKDVTILDRVTVAGSESPHVTAV